MVCALVSGSSGPGPSPGRGYCVVVFLGKTPNSHSASLSSSQVYKWVPVNLVLAVTLRWTSIPFRRSRKTSNRFMLQKPEKSAGLMGSLALMQT